jgi:hypothetical protein
MVDMYDTPPAGFVRSNKGWLIKPPTSGDKRLAKLEKENQELRQMLQQIMEKLGDSNPDILSQR